MTHETTTETPAALPGLDRAVYKIRGPHILIYGDGEGVDITGDLTIAYQRQGTPGTRRWTIEAAVDRYYLLQLSQAGAIATTPLEIARYNIHDPVTLTFEPDPDLAATLDAIEDEGPLVSPVTHLLDARIRMRVIDTRNLVFVRASQRAG